MAMAVPLDVAVSSSATRIEIAANAAAATPLEPSSSSSQDYRHP
jgi:hypothetical protein